MDACTVWSWGDDNAARGARACRIRTCNPPYEHSTLSLAHPDSTSEYGETMRPTPFYIAPVVGSTPNTPWLDPAVCTRALGARDARFDGVFYVGITTTRVYCRPVCPARVSYPSHRRFFSSAASAERAGFRPCMRCRPELAPGRALIDAIPRLARVAAYRIGAGALNGSSVAELARELGVSERHLRRVLESSIGVSPVELAQTHRLLLAKRLLADTDLSITRVAYASGFQSLRRFNAVFRERYRMTPSAIRRAPRVTTLRDSGHSGNPVARPELVRLTLAYRAPLDWETLISMLQCEAIVSVSTVQGGSFGRTVAVEGRCGVVFVENAPARRDSSGAVKTHLDVRVSPSLLPVLMPLLARLRQLFDLDAEPAAIDAHLTQGGLAAFVTKRRGLRIPGALDGFEVLLQALLSDASTRRMATNDRVRHVIAALGEPIETGFPTLARLTPTAARVAEAGAERLTALGVPRRRAQVISTVARSLADAELLLEPAADVAATRRALMTFGIEERLATTIVMRALYWPDAFPSSDRVLQREAGCRTATELKVRAEPWRPWRAYAAMHFWLHSEEKGRARGR